MSGRGRLILVVGASGAGKDTLIGWASTALPAGTAVRFVDLEITRPANDWGRHDPISPQTFVARRDAGGYVLHWEAHGACYGVPPVARESLESGVSVVTIGSRAVIDVARALPWEVHVIEIRAPYEVLRSRLAARGREGHPDIEARLKRSSELPVSGNHVHVIDNDGALPASGGAFTQVLIRLAGGHP